MYMTGRVVLQDYTEGISWYRKAAEQGHPFAQLQLGACYLNGLGVPQDYVRAHMWLNLAASQGNQDAAEARESLTKDMTREQVAEAQRLAREWKQRKQGTRP